jgi:PAS domain S-box-containing protein
MSLHDVRPTSRRGWPAPRLQALLDGLSDGVMGADHEGRIIYANAAAERLLGWPEGELLGTPVSLLFPARLQDWMGDDFAAFVSDRLPRLAGQTFEGTLVRHNGSEVPIEIITDEAPAGRDGSVVVGIVRQRRVERLSKWSELTQRLFDTLAEPGAAPPARERLLAALGSELGWEATTLWSIDPDGELVRRASWSDPAIDLGQRLLVARPERASEGATLPLHALESGQPFCVSDLTADPRFALGGAALSGVRSAVVFPVRFADQVVGVVEMLSTERRAADPELVELVEAVSAPVGELLVAHERASERERLVAELEQARRDQAFLLDASRVLAEASDYRDTLRRLAEVAVPTLADLCIIDVLDENSRFRRLACQHYDPAKTSLVRELQHDFPPDPTGVHPSIDVVRQGRSRWSPEMSDEFLQQTTRNERHFEVVKALGFTSYIVVPLVGDNAPIGAVTLVSAGSGRRFNERDVASAEQLAVQVGSVVERARRHEHEHLIAHTLQQSLLPDRLPVVAGLELAARYQPGSDFTEVGGDWYDVIKLGERIALVVGDVEGHDMEAASVMGKLRNGLSAFLTETESAGDALGRLDRFATVTGTERMATVQVVMVDPASGQASVASAGHPPPVLITGDRVDLVDLEPSPPIGARLNDCPPPETHFVLTGPLLLYTDGLVEHRHRDLALGLQQLVEVMGAAPRLTPGALCDHVIATMLDETHQRDDVALLAAQPRPEP